jgi:hypothetical protein
MRQQEESDLFDDEPTYSTSFIFASLIFINWQIRYNDEDTSHTLSKVHLQLDWVAKTQKVKLISVR